MKKFGTFIKAFIAAFVVLACLIGGYYLGNVRGEGRVRSSVVTDWGIDEIGELSTGEYWFTKVMTFTGDPKQIFGVNVPLTGKKFIYSIDGYVKAGFDFADITAEVDKEGKTICFILPEAKVLDVKADPGTCKVYDETKNIFNPITVEDIMSSQAEVEKEAQTEAVEHGVLEKAAENAQQMLKQLAQTYAPDYTVTFK